MDALIWSGDVSIRSQIFAQVDETSDDAYFGGSASVVLDSFDEAFVTLAVGAYGDSTLGHLRGAVWIVFLLPSDGTVHRYVKIASGDDTQSPVLQDYDRFGRSVASLGDLDGG